MTFEVLLPSPKTTMLLRWEKRKLLAFLFFPSQRAAVNPIYVAMVVAV